MAKKIKQQPIEELRMVMARLRGPDGCPWDREQDHESIKLNAVEEVYELVGPFKFERNDLHITDDLKQKIIANCAANKYQNFGPYKVKELKTTDGYKYFFDDERWLMIRPSGTEPVLRNYAEAPTLEEVRKILKICEQTITA